MKHKKIAFVSIPKAGKSSLISCLTEFQWDMISLGFHPNVSIEKEASANNHIKTIWLRETRIEIIESSTLVRTVLDGIDGLVVVIPSNDLVGSESYHLWSWAVSTGLPCIAFVSKIDLAIHAPKYLKSIQRKLKNTIPVNQDYLHLAVCKGMSGMTWKKRAEYDNCFPLLFGSATIKIGIFDLMKTIAQYIE